MTESQAFWIDDDFDRDHAEDGMVARPRLA